MAGRLVASDQRHKTDITVRGGGVKGGSEG
jgi:hypothetical protein